MGGVSEAEDKKRACQHTSFLSVLRCVASDLPGSDSLRGAGGAGLCRGEGCSSRGSGEI